MPGTFDRIIRTLLPRIASGAVVGFGLMAGPAAAVTQADSVPLPRANPREVSTPAENPRELLANISNYFNRFQTMQGEFIQFGPNGEQSEGVFFISRPGKIRFHYKPPVNVDVIADGRSVAVRDKRVGTQDLYPLSKTPLRYLLSNNIDLASANIVSNVDSEPDLISLEIKENKALQDGKLTLIFDNQTYELRQWIVTDAQGLQTSVAIYNVSTGLPVDPSLFDIYAYRDVLGQR